MAETPTPQALLTDPNAQTTGTGGRLDTALLATLTMGTPTAPASTLGTRTTSAVPRATKR
ncbi:unnamed protein product [Rhizoctonia solani]|uniref:Uncharacterized protein n=1 Tax=Rhizoctonia solani TaxID=456999 RepID=A0A8H2WT10_9AGAM|nr:unnamed protein product [Rhizoctonia solani]